MQYCTNEAKELAELGENIDDLAESASNLREEMLALTGVDIMIDDKNFKSYYQQLLDISKVYQSLDETTQANVLEKMFGKNRSAAGANILKAMADTVEVYNEALHSAGSSQEEFSRWTESAEAATKRFGVALTETYNNIISGDTVKGLANVGAALLDLVNKLGLVEKGFKGFLVIGAMKGITTLSVALKNSAVQLSNYGKALDAVKKVSTHAQGTQEYAKAMNTLKNSCTNLTDAQLKQVLANRNLEKSQLIEILQLKDLNAEEKEARLAQLGLIKTTKEQTTVNGKASVSTFSLKAAMKGLKTSIMEAWAAMSALQKASIVFAAVSTVWSVISLAMDAQDEARQKAEKAFKEATDSAKSFSQAVKDIKKETVDMEKSVDSIIDRYAELSQGVDSFTNKNKSLSTDKYEEFLDLNKQLAGLFPFLTRNYDENGNAILGLSGSVDSVTESIKKLVEQEKELAKAKIRENLEQYFDGTKDADGAWKALEGRKKALEELNEEQEKLTNTYNTLINSDKKIKLGNFTKNQVQSLKESYLQYFKDYFGKDISDAVEKAISFEETYDSGIKAITSSDYTKHGNLVVDFSKLELTDSQKEKITSSYDTFYGELLAKQKTAMSEFDSQNSEFSNNALLWLEDISFYKNSDKYVQLAMQNLVGSIDWSDYDAKQLDYEGVKRIIQDSILTPFQVACNNPDTKKELNETFANLFTLDMSNMSVKDIASKINTYINTIAAAIGEEDPIELKARLGFADIDDTYNRLQNSLLQLTRDEDYAVRYMYDDMLSEYTKDFTQAQVELWLEATRGAENATQAVEMYEAALEKKKEEATRLSSVLTKSEESLDKFQSSVKSAADAYTTLLSGNYSSSELLDSIQAINKAVTDMGKAIDWESIAASDNPLKAIQDEIESVSNTYAESVLGKAGINTNSDFGKMLANIVQEAYKSEAALNSLNIQIDSLQSAYNDLTDIVDSYNKTGYVTFDQLQTLLAMEPQYLSCLIDENGQLQLNQEAMTALANQRLNDARAQIIEQTIAELGELQFKKEKTAIEGVTMALEDSDDTITSYEERLLDFIPTAELTTEEFIKLSNAINGATSNGVSDEDIDEVFQNAEKKLKLLKDMWNGNLKNMLGGSSSEKDTTKEFDWIEQAIENVEKEVKNLDEVVNSTYSTFSQKNEALAKEIGKVSEEIALQQKAYEEYMRKADSIGLPDYYKALIRDGAINIENITDENLQKKISDYQQWYEKAVDVSETISDLNEQMKDLHVKGYELQAERLEELLDSNSITEKQYLAEIKSLYKEYYEDQVEYAQKAHEVKMALLEKEKSYLNSVAGAASSLLDKEIDTIRDNAELQEEALNKQIEAHNAQIDLLNEKKKLLQDELDALEDKARDENLILDLQQKQYDLKRAENQRSKLVKYMPDAIVI